MNQTDFGPSVPSAVTVDKRAWQALRADNERLREVLEELLDACDVNLGSCHPGPLGDARRAGRAALRRT